MGVLASPPPWWLGGLVFGVVVVALRFALNERLGVLGGYSELVERATGRVRALGWKSFFLIGVVGGGWLYGLAAGRWGGAHRYGWIGRDFPHHAGVATGVAPTAAGLLIGFGARTAGGCTSGNGFGGTTSGSPASFVATATFFATAVGASFLLRGLVRVRARLAALVLGVPFGFTIAWGGMNDPQVIRRMLLLQSVYLYKMFALGVFVGLVGSLLLRRRRPRALVTRQPVEWERARPERRHVVGSLIFGCGWSISSSCPGPIATQLATGLWWSGFTIVGIGGGIVLFFAAQDRKARSAATDAVPELAVPG